MQHDYKKSLLALSLLTGTSLLAGCGGSSSTTEPTNIAPVLSGNATVTVAENITTVATYTASDADGNSLTFSLSGADAALFTIDADGNLSFIDPPDFENGQVGPYEVIIIVTDNGEGNLTAQISVSVTVSNEVDPATKAIVQTIAADYVSGSEVMFIDGQSQQVTGPYYVKTQTDYSLDTYGANIYHIGSFFIDTIEKYHADAPDTQLWSFSTQDGGDSTSRNPYALVSLNDAKAYLIRYGSDKVWIVNPQATQAEDFKIGELDLSPYNLPGSVGGTPNPASGTIVDGKLYISMQRFSDDFSQIGAAYIAVFDTATDEEIETNANSEDNMMGIPLLGTNPARNGLYSANDMVYVTTTKPYFSGDLTQSRIEAISTGDYSLNQVLDATVIEGNVSATIKGSAIVSADKGYFFTSAYDANFNETSTLYEFNPTTGAIVATDVGGNGTEAISYATLDQSNILWMSMANPTNPGVDLIDTQTNSKVGTRLATQLNPGVIRFID